LGSGDRATSQGVPKISRKNLHLGFCRRRPGKELNSRRNRKGRRTAFCVHGGCCSKGIAENDIVNNARGDVMAMKKESTEGDGRKSEHQDNDFLEKYRGRTEKTRV